MIAGAIGAALLSPAPVSAVAREIIELQENVQQLIQGQQAIQTAITQNNAVQKTLIEQSLDSVNKLSGTMTSLQKSVQDMQANAGARLDTMSTQVQGVSDNVQEMLARMGKLNQQLTDAQNAIQGIDAKLAGSAPPQQSPSGASGTYPNGPAPTPAPPPSGFPANPPFGQGTPGTSGQSAPPSQPPPAAPNNASYAAPPRAAAPSADLLYSNGLRDLNGHKYDLATQEFQDYMKYYPGTDLASNAQFYLGEIAFAQQQYDQAVDDYNKVIQGYPRSFKTPPAHLKKGLALIQLGDKNSGIRELRNVVKLYPGTDEERRARAKLHEMGLAA